MDWKEKTLRSKGSCSRWVAECLSYVIVSLPEWQLGADDRLMIVACTFDAEHSFPLLVPLSGREGHEPAASKVPRTLCHPLVTFHRTCPNISRCGKKAGRP